MVFAVMGTSFGQSAWVWKSPLPQANPLYCAAYGLSVDGSGGLFVAVGLGGAIVTSPDDSVCNRKKFQYSQ